MSLTACAQIVEQGDPDRFLATMAAPPGLRGLLFPLYAYNVEVSRAPWVSAEPMIGAMRLQWWADALEEIAQARPVRRHEVVTPLAQALDPEAAHTLTRGIEARHWDLHRDPFATEAAFWTHLEDTSAGLLWTAARLAGAPPETEAQVRAWGRAQGLANWLLAIPRFEAAGRIPLVDGRPQAIRALATQALDALGAVPLSRKTRPALWAAWQAPALLKQAQKEPTRVATGRLGLSEFGKRARLLKTSVIGR